MKNIKSTIHSDHHTENSLFGFWIYIMTDLIMFAALFATFAALRNSTFGGPSAQQIISLPFVLTETFILLFSSFTCGLALLASQQNKIKMLISWLTVTFILGATFLAIELTAFRS